MGWTTSGMRNSQPKLQQRPKLRERALVLKFVIKWKILFTAHRFKQTDEGLRSVLVGGIYASSV